MSGLPPPEINDATRPYWDAANAGRFVLPLCAACTKAFYPPAELCPFCWSSRIDWRPVSGEGVVITFTVVHQAPGEARQAIAPYVLAIIELAEGPRMMANVIGSDRLGVQIGDRVRVTFEQRGTQQIPQFEREKR